MFNQFLVKNLSTVEREKGSKEKNTNWTQIINNYYTNYRNQTLQKFRINSFLVNFSSLEDNHRNVRRKKGLFEKEFTQDSGRVWFL